MTRDYSEGPWWTLVAAITASLAICAAVWFGIFNLASVGARFAEAKVMEGKWSQEMVFDTSRPLATGRSVFVKRPD